jgi:hypothetical protein
LGEARKLLLVSYFQLSCMFMTTLNGTLHDNTLLSGLPQLNSPPVSLLQRKISRHISSCDSFLCCFDLLSNSSLIQSKEMHCDIQSYTQRMSKFSVFEDDLRQASSNISGIEENSINFLRRD